MAQRDPGRATATARSSVQTGRGAAELAADARHYRRRPPIGSTKTVLDTVASAACTSAGVAPRNVADKAASTRR